MNCTVGKFTRAKPGNNNYINLIWRFFFVRLVDIKNAKFLSKKLKTLIVFYNYVLTRFCPCEFTHGTIHTSRYSYQAELSH